MNNITGYHPADCDTQLGYVKQCCPETEKGGIRHFILVNKNYQNTLLSALDAAGTDKEKQHAAFMAAKLAGKMVVVPNVVGEYDGGSPTESQGYGGAQTRITGKEHTATIDDVNVVNNREFADALAKTQNWILWFVTGSLIWNTHEPCGGVANMPVGREYTSEVMYQYVFKWSSITNPQHYWAPDALFDCTEPDMSVDFVSVAPGPPTVQTFDAQLSDAATAVGAITLRRVTFLSGAGVTSDVTSSYTLAAANIAINDTDKTLVVTGPTTQTAGTYTFTFVLTGAGRDEEQEYSTVQIVP